MKSLFVVFAFAFALLPMAAQADEHGTLTALLENDSFINQSDRHYTNGLYVSWTGVPSKPDGGLLQDVAQAVMLPGQDGESWRSGFFAGQSMFTPENLDAAIPPKTDRPYAGWLYAGMRLYRDSGDTLDSVGVTLGLVGPGSLAADLQKSWHQAHLLGGIYPNGWHYQLHGEPGLVLGEQRIWRVDLIDGPLEAELLPQANVQLGNVFTYAGAGAMLRIGSGLKADWGPVRILPGQTGADFRSGEGMSWYAFAGLEGRVTPRNLFLNGSSFEDSPRVSSKLLTGDFSAGLALLLPSTRLTASYVRRSNEFVGQKGNDAFVSIGVSVAN